MQILSDNDPIDVLAAILKYSLEDELNEKKYKEIAEVSVDNKGTSRLFVSFGRKDGLTPRKLVKLINNDTKVHSGKISEVKVMDSFSFLTVPFEEAEIIPNAFNHRKSAQKPHIQKAKSPMPKSK